MLLVETVSGVIYIALKSDTGLQVCIVLYDWEMQMHQTDFL